MKSAFNARLYLTAMGVFACAALFAESPNAQERPSAGATSVGTIESVTVSGTKRDEQSQTVPIAVTAVSGDQLATQFRNDILAIADLSPGVTLGQVAGFRAIAGGIRGTGQNSILVTQDSSVVILVDEFALSNVQAQFVEMFDIERVEVYRGPQGTLFGKSATGGAISFVSKRPVMNEFSGEAEFQAGIFAGGDGSPNAAIGKGKFAVNIPLVQDKLAARVTAFYDYDDGFYKNDKNTATFPNSIPIWNAVAEGLGVPVASLLPPELDTRTVGGGENINGTDIFSGRFKLLFTPTDNYEAYFTFDILRDRSDNIPGINETPGGEGFLLELLGFPGIQQAGHTDVFRTGVTNQCIEGNSQGLCLSAGQRVSVESYNLQQKLNLDTISFHLITAYRKQREILPNTYTGEAFTSLFDASRNTVKENAQFELRASTSFDGPFNFVSGAVYSREETDMLSFATVGLSSLVSFVDPDRNDGIPGPLFDARGFFNFDLDFINDLSMTGAKQDRNTYAFYLDGTYEVTDRISLSAGFRYTYDEKTFFRRQNPGGPCTDRTPAKDQVLVGGNCLDARSNSVSRVGADFSAKDLQAFNIPLPDSAFGIAETFKGNWDRITWRAVMDYKFADEGLAYVSYATGFIPGGFTETCSSIATCQPFESETNWNIEGGVKARFLDGTLQTNAAVFYTRYSDLVRSQVLPFTNAFGVTTQETVNVNAGKSEVFGIELEAVWVPTSDLRFDLSAGYMDHDYIEFMLNGVDLSDRTVPFSPKLKLSGGVTFNQEIGNGGSLVYNTSVNYQSKAEMSVFNSTFTQMNSRVFWDANVTWRDAEQKYRFTLFVKNILDDRARIAANSVAGLWNFTQYDRPRSLGAEVGFNF